MKKDIDIYKSKDSRIICKFNLYCINMFILLLFSMVLLLQDFNVYAAPARYVKSLISKSNVTINVGNFETVPIKVNVVGSANKKISYKVKNKKIAKVKYSKKTSKLIITGVKKGSTKITITTKGRNNKGKKLTRVIKVTVNAADNSSAYNTDKTKTRSDKTTESKKEENNNNEKTYSFRKASYLTQHFEKHGSEMGYKTEEDYLKGANKVINNSKALHKLEAEDNDHIYYIEETNEIVFLSQDGYIRTYFICSGKAYYDRQ